MQQLTEQYVVRGVNQSYFTRKVTGYLDYKAIPWWLSHAFGRNERDAEALGWNGGIPTIHTPDGRIMWDSTSVLVHLEEEFPEPAILPEDPTLRFLAFLFDDIGDEWFYRHALSTRWRYPENTMIGSWDLTREGAWDMPQGLFPIRDLRTLTANNVTSSLRRFGVDEQNYMLWIDQSLRPWQRAFADHCAAHGFLLGDRPCLGDFSLFGGNAAHFTNDPLCREWAEAAGPGLLTHTHRLMEPRGTTFGDWLAVDDLPDSLFALLAECGRHYLPWVAEATTNGSAAVAFDSYTRVEVEATGFLTWARGVLLARYVDLRNDTLDAVLDRAGILGFFADHVAEATAVPDPTVLPQPADNRPYPTAF
jgi:glutathione S-transferase